MNFIEAAKKSKYARRPRHGACWVNCKNAFEENYDDLLRWQDLIADDWEAWDVKDEIEDKKESIATAEHTIRTLHSKAGDPNYLFKLPDNCVVGKRLGGAFKEIYSIPLCETLNSDTDSFKDFMAVITKKLNKKPKWWDLKGQYRRLRRWYWSKVYKKAYDLSDSKSFLEIHAPTEAEKNIWKGKQVTRPIRK